MMRGSSRVMTVKRRILGQERGARVSLPENSRELCLQIFRSQSVTAPVSLHLPDASLEPSAPAVAAPPSVTPAPPKPSGSPPAKAESAPPKPPAPVLKSEILPPPKPPAPAPQAKPAPLPRPTPPASPRPPAEEKRRPEAPASTPSAQAKAAPRLVEPPRAPAEEARQSEGLPGGSMPHMPPVPAPPAVPKIPLGPERQKLTPEQELAMVQRSPQEREEAGKSAGNGKQALAEHFARLEKHQPLALFRCPRRVRAWPGTFWRRFRHRRGWEVSFDRLVWL